MERVQTVPKSIKEQDAIIFASSLRGEKRSQQEDTKVRIQILLNNGYTISFNFPKEELPDEPTLLPITI